MSTDNKDEKKNTTNTPGVTSDSLQNPSDAPSDDEQTEYGNKVGDTRNLNEKNVTFAADSGTGSNLDGGEVIIRTPSHTITAGDVDQAKVKFGGDEKKAMDALQKEQEERKQKAIEDERKASDGLNAGGGAHGVVNQQGEVTTSSLAGSTKKSVGKK